MRISIRNKEGFYIAVLVFGLVLLGFTFVQAYLLLLVNVQITGAEFTDIFGSSMQALVTACIKIIYLGVMGWVGALVTARGVTLLQQPRSEVKPKEEEKPTEKPAAS
jgi:hypothetical protein